MRYAKIETNSVSNGTGIRVVLYVQGCSVHCPGCHNESTWDFNGGQIFTEKELNIIFNELDKPYVKGITFSGGHPLEYPNLSDCLELAANIKINYPNKDIWLYTGYTLKESDFKLSEEYGGRQNGKTLASFLRLCDVIVDGPFIENQRDLTLKFRGSQNQRLIDVKATLANKKITLLDN